MSLSHLHRASALMTRARTPPSGPSSAAWGRARRRAAGLAVNVPPPAGDRFGYLKRVYD